MPEKKLPSVLGGLELNLINGVPLPVHFDITEISDGSVTDLTNYTAKLQIRPSYEDKETALVELLSPTDISLGGVLGTVDFTVPAQDWEYDSLVWTIRLINGSGVADIIVGGDVNITRDAVQ